MTHTERLAALALARSMRDFLRISVAAKFMANEGFSLEAARWNLLGV